MTNLLRRCLELREPDGAVAWENLLMHFESFRGDTHSLEHAAMDRLLGKGTNIMRFRVLAEFARQRPVYASSPKVILEESESIQHCKITWNRRMDELITLISSGHRRITDPLPVQVCSVEERLGTKDDKRASSLQWTLYLNLSSVAHLNLESREWVRKERTGNGTTHLKTRAK